MTVYYILTVKYNTNNVENMHKYINIVLNNDFILILKVRYITATGYGLEAVFRFPAGKRHFSLIRNVQTGSGAHPVSYKMTNLGYLPGSIAAGA
jgi:hypothetical protein